MNRWLRRTTLCFIKLGKMLDWREDSQIKAGKLNAQDEIQFLVSDVVEIRSQIDITNFYSYLTREMLRNDKVLLVNSQ